MRLFRLLLEHPSYMYLRTTQNMLMTYWLSGELSLSFWLLVLLFYLFIQYFKIVTYLARYMMHNVCWHIFHDCKDDKFLYFFIFTQYLDCRIE